MTLATVESCTAVALAHLLSQGGASDVLHGGFIVYTKENKMAAVGVPEALLEKHTAVSAEVARAMARGGLKRCPATIVAAITGVAGPEAVMALIAAIFFFGRSVAPDQEPQGVEPRPSPRP